MDRSRIIQIFLGMLLFLGVAFHGYRIANGAQVTPSETYLITLILTGLSWLLSSSVSKSNAELQAEAEASNKIDAIAKQSSKKLADQSTNIFELEQFVEHVLLQKNEIGEKLDETDLYALIQILRTLRRTNTGLMEDWNGVATNDLSSSIQEMARNQQTLFDHIARPNWQDSNEANDLKISDISKNLPTSAVPSGKYAEYRQPVVRSVNQTVSQDSSENGASGSITVKTMRPTFGFTFSGKFDPVLTGVPDAVVAKLVSCPNGAPDNVRVRAGSGTDFDFSVHLKSDDYGVELPSGSYTVEYFTK